MANNSKLELDLNKTDHWWDNNQTKLNDENMNTLTKQVVLNANKINALAGDFEDFVQQDYDIPGLIDAALTAGLKEEEDERVAEDEAITAGYIAADNALEAKINDELSKLKDTTDLIVKTPGFTLDTNIKPNAVEVGTVITPEYQITFDSGKYKYGPDPTGCVATYDITFNGATLTTAEGSFAPFRVTDLTSINFIATCTYSNGASPKDNFGTDYGEGIKGSIKYFEETLTGFRQAFAGGSASKDTPVGELTSTEIRELTPQGADTKEFEFTIDPDAVRVIIAFPGQWGELQSVLDFNNGNTNSVNSFVQSEVEVSGATNESDMMTYKVCVLEFSEPYGGNGNTYKVKIS